MKVSVSQTSCSKQLHQNKADRQLGGGFCWNYRSLNYGREFVNVEIVFRTVPLMSYVESDGWTGGSDG